jgi:tRNA pseudouridine55 synthase
VVLADKKQGPSSFAVVQQIRARHGLKAGHAGTLDPFATGLLLCLLGRATRLARYLVGLDKRYVTEIELGLRTTTGDTEGDELGRTEPATSAAIDALRGDLELRIPAASAVKIGGERAYRLHRRGAPVEMPTRRSTIYELRVLRFEPPVLELALHVSSGTYVRAIADALGGHCRSLRRVAVGPFRVEDADETRVLPPEDAVPFLERRDLTRTEAELVRAGRPVPGEAEGAVALLEDGALVAVARGGEGMLRPETVIA